MVLENDSRGKLRPAAEQHTGIDAAKTEAVGQRVFNRHWRGFDLAPENKSFCPVKSRITQPIANKEISFPHG